MVLLIWAAVGVLSLLFVCCIPEEVRLERERMLAENRKERGEGGCMGQRGK